jgi:hypothetical protein
MSIRFPEIILPAQTERFGGSAGATTFRPQPRIPRDPAVSLEVHDVLMRVEDVYRIDRVYTLALAVRRKLFSY